MLGKLNTLYTTSQRRNTLGFGNWTPMEMFIIALGWSYTSI